MTRKFVYWNYFSSVCKVIGIDDYAMQKVESTLLLNPETGDMVEGTGGARKMRIRLEGRGKRSGGRVIYYDTGTVIHFLLVYTKRMQADLSHDQKEAIHKITRSIRKE